MADEARKSPGWQRGWMTVGVALAVMASASTVVSVVALWAARNGYPYDLEWMEGGMLTHAWRLLHGRATHTEPTVDWIPYLYPTGYASTVAFLAKFFGLSMSLGRTISAVGTLCAALALPFITHRLKRGILPGIIAGAVYLSCYPFSGAFYDLVRLDGLMMGLFAWSIALSLDRRRFCIPAAGLLLCAAFAVKHNVALVGLPIVFGLWHRDGWRTALRFGLWSAVPALALTVYLDIVNDGHYLTWLLTVPSSHSWAAERIFPGIGKDHGHALPFLCIAAMTALLLALPERRSAKVIAAVAVTSGLITSLIAHHDTLFEPSLSLFTLWVGLAMVYSGLLVGLGLAARRLASKSWRFTFGVGVAGTTLAMSMLMRGHVGGFINVNMPAHWVICLAGAVALGSVGRDLQAGPRSVRAPLMVTLAVMQLAWGAWWLDRDALTPTVAAREAGDALVTELTGLPEPVLSPFNPWLLVLAGHDEPGWHLIALWDVDHASGPWPDSGAMVDAAIAREHWTFILDGSRELGHGVGDHYTRGERVVPGAVMRPLSGFRVYPTRLRARQSERIRPLRRQR